VWIAGRDRVGLIVDDLLREKPSPELRAAVELLEDALRAGDYAIGVL
jgi:hypothetical protein